MLRTVCFEPEVHYATICEWWEAHKWPCIPLKSLPKLGLVIYVDDIPAAAVWLYRTDSNLGWMEWMISNPKIAKSDRNLAITKLIDEAVVIAKHLQIEVIFTSTKVARLIRRFQDVGFTINDAQMTNLTKVVI